MKNKFAGVSQIISIVALIIFLSMIHQPGGALAQGRFDISPESVLGDKPQAAPKKAKPKVRPAAEKGKKAKRAATAAEENPAPAPAKKAAQTGVTDSVTGMEFVFVKGGCYEMGDTFGDGYADEKPVHEVCVGDFRMGKYEVTQGQWQAVMGSNPSHFSGCGDNCPVEQVSWNDVRQFIEKLNSRTGKRYRLPTEAEWEYAAREGGRKVRFGTGSDMISAETANFDASAGYKQPYSEAGLYRRKTTPVGTFRPNALGLYDMTGNVWEWCQDWYGDKYYADSSRDNPKGSYSGNLRVLRGGSWGNEPGDGRAAYRDGSSPDDRFTSLGFRLVLPPQD